MKRAVFLLACLISFLFLLDVFGLNSDSIQKKKTQEAEEHEVTVTLKLVQVYVTDKKGNSITDLNKSDFILYEDGKLKKITDFEKHVLSMPSTKTDLKDREVPLPSKPKLNRKFFLFFDFAFNNAIGILNSKKAALHFIGSSLQSTDEVGVLSYSTAKNFTIHKNLTTNHPEVREVVEGFGVKEVLGRAERIEGEYWRKIREIEELSKRPPEHVDKLELERKKREMDTLEFERYRFKHDISIFLETIKDLAKALRYIPGHKHIIFFSSGIPSSIFGGMQARGREFVNGTFGDVWLRTEYEQMIKELAASNSAVYSVHSEGEDSDMNLNKSSDETPITLEAPINTRQLLGISSLQRLAEVTGGKYFGNIKSYETIMKEIQNVTGSYYVLGYYISEEWDGKYHKIKVKVKRKGCDVRTQGGYFNPKSFHKFSKLEKQLDFIDLAIEAGSRFQAPLYFNLNTFPFVMKGTTGLVMISKISNKEAQEISGKKVEIANVIFDEQEEVVDFKRWEADFSKFPKKDIYYYSLSSLSPGKYTYRVIIRNLETGKSALASTSVNVPGIPDSGISLNSPLLLALEKDTFYLKGSVIEKEEGPVRLLDVYPFDLSQFTPIIEEIAQGTSRIIAVLPCSLFNNRQPEIKPFARLIYITRGIKIPLKISLLNKKQEGDKQVFYLGLQMDELEPGKYRLDFLAKETKTQSMAIITTFFEVK